MRCPSMPRLLVRAIFSGFISLIGCHQEASEHLSDQIIRNDSIAKQAWKLRRNQPEVSDSISRMLLRTQTRKELPDSIRSQLWKTIAAIHWFSGRLDSASLTADSALVYFLRAADSLQVGNVYNLKGLIDWHASKYDAALNSFGKAYNMFVQQSDSDGMMMALSNTSIIYYQLGDYDTAMALLMEVTPYNETKHNLQALGDNYANLSIILGVQKDMDKSLLYKRKSLAIAEQLEDQRAILLSLANLGTHFFNDSRYDSAMHYNKLALALSVRLGDRHTQAFLLNNMAETYYTLNLLPAADQSIAEAIKIRTELDDVLGLSISYRIKGLLLEAKGNTNEAVNQYSMALNMAERIGSKEQQMNLSEQLYDVCFKRGDFKKALQYKQAASILRDTLFSQKQNERIQRLQIQYETVSKDKALVEKEFKLLTLGLEKKAFELRMYLFLAISVFSVSILLIYSYFNRKKAQQEAFKHLQAHEIHLLTLQKAELEQKRLEDELAYKNKEITTLALMLSDKRSMVLEVEQQVEALLDYEQKDSSQKLNQLLKDLRIRRTLERETSDFERNIDLVCDGFFIKLEDRFPDISQAEKRLAALLRMNLSSKEIAGILNISPKSVDMGRYRLRKKLGLDSEDGLYETLSKI